MAAAWPFAARAQRTPIPVIGFLRTTSFDDSKDIAAGFRIGLQESGFIEGQNGKVEFRFAEGRDDLLPKLVANLIDQKVAVIVASALGPARAAKAATSTVPIVFAIQGDPVELGLVASLARPAGNITGVAYLTAALGPKRLALVHELVPSVTTIAALVNPNNLQMALYVRDVEQAASALGLQCRTLNVATEKEIDIGFAGLHQQQVKAVIVGADPLFTAWRMQIISSAARHRVPAIYPSREWAKDGGLLAYGPNLADVYRQVGSYAMRIVRGAQPSDLPVEQPVKFDLTINLKTAKALGLTVPNTLLISANEIIE